MIRVVLTLWLSLLLIGMQQRLVVHEIDHLRAKIERGDAVVLQSADGGACLECSLLASGSNAVPLDDAFAASLASASSTIVVAFECTRVHSSPASYRSRAPPVSA